MVILRKPRNPYYVVPNAHCPIALLNMIHKILSARMAETLPKWLKFMVYSQQTSLGVIQAELPQTLCIMSPVCEGCLKKSEVVSAFFLNIKGAFPSINLGQLMHNMRKGRV